MVRDFLRAWVDPSLRILEETWGVKHRFVYTSLRWLLRKKLQRLEDVELLVDSEAFSRSKRYMIFLFRVPDA